MSTELTQQEEYWDREVRAFDSIYSREKGAFGKFLDSVFRWDMYARYEYTLQHAEPIEGKTFLDVGCGTGRYAIELARRKARHVVGLDIAENMVEVCRARAAEEGLAERTTFIQSDLLQYRPAEKFDTCIGIGLFDYIRDPVPVLSRMCASVNRSVIVSFPKRRTWRAPLRKVRLGLKGCGVYFYSMKRLEAVLKQSGFADFRCQEVGQLYCVTAYPK